VNVNVERRVIGVIEVDSGTVVVGDPVYALPYADRSKAGIDYSALPDLTGAPAYQLGDQPVVLLSNFGGDGAYPVIGEFEDGGFTRAVIEFEPLEED